MSSDARWSEQIAPGRAVYPRWPAAVALKSSHRARKGAHADGMGGRRRLVKSPYSFIPARAAMG
jgi:hypothetical protein